MRTTIAAALLLVFGLQPAGAQDKKPVKPKVYPRVSADLLEGVLKGLELDFKKEPDKDKIDAYLFQRGDAKIRLVNYEGGDLWIEAVFDKKLPLEQANDWNARAKYTRCVVLDADVKSSVSLEMQLDCINGVTEGMVRQFLVRFGGELKDFQKVVGK
jgi:hypothetical protein